MTKFAVVVLSLLLPIVVAFHKIRPISWKTKLLANKMDGVTIEGDLIPLSNNLLIKVKEIASSTSGGLFIPDNAKERPTEGTKAATVNS